MWGLNQKSYTNWYDALVRVLMNLIIVSMEHDWREPRGPLLRPLYTSLPLFTFDLAGEGMEREREGVWLRKGGESKYYYHLAMVCVICHCQAVYSSSALHTQRLKRRKRMKLPLPPETHTLTPPSTYYACMTLESCVISMKSKLCYCDLVIHQLLKKKKYRFLDCNRGYDGV